MRDELLSLLDEQSDLTLNFCNAFTAMSNATTEKKQNDSLFGNEMHAVMQELLRHASLVQRHLAKLEGALTIDGTTSDTNQSEGVLYQAWMDHIACTKRVLAALHQICARFSPEGIPLAVNSTSLSSTDAQRLALVTLRASIQNVRHVVEAQIWHYGFLYMLRIKRRKNTHMVWTPPRFLPTTFHGGSSRFP